jgi:multicomponent Na+:H+ antiporter subunit B
MELHLLIFFMICASVMAVEIKDLISSVIALSAAGLGLCLAFLILKAPNLAITQLVVEILCVILLVRSTINKDLPLVKDGRWLFNTAATLIFIVCFLMVAYLALRELPPFGESLARVSAEYLSTGMEKTGSANIVTAITLYFRGSDALGEAAVLFAALIGVLAIIRKVGKINEAS